MNILVVKDKNHFPITSFNSDHAKLIKKAYPEAKIDTIDNISSESSQQFLKQADVMILPTSLLNTVNFKKTTSLKWLHITSAGVDKLPDEILRSSIIVTNSSGVHPIPIAEHVFTFMLMFARQLHKSYRQQVEKKTWLRTSDFLPTTEVYGKTIGIVGLGRIGKRIAKVAKGFDMQVVALTRTKHKKEDNVDKQYTDKDVDKLLKASDFVIGCLPGTKESNHFFDLKKFSKMKPTAYFINIGRGKTVNEKDLIKALKKNIISGAGLDVFEEEPLPKDSPLWDLENVIITPHYAGWTPYYLDRVIEIFSENLKAYAKDNPMPNLINKTRGY
ncbi:D-2-hydroxyacid dehydrogenase [Candidatus Parcubacteria bacterium]|nr:MAG: D-2-hydroxyacid dehydrogenase [Candidatus Parcubacteria bacterium]